MKKKVENKPVATVRYGAISASIWKRESDKGAWYSVTLSRSYLDNNEWKHSDSFGRDELLLVAKVVNEAHTRIYELQTEV